MPAPSLPLTPTLQRPLARAVAMAVLLLGEYLALAVQFDGTKLTALSGQFVTFQAANAVAIGSAILTAGVLMRARELGVRLLALTSALGPISWRWLAAHAVSYLALSASSFALFHPQQAALPSGVTAALWVASGVVSCATLLRALFGAVALPMAALLGRGFAGGALVGTAAWYVAWFLRPYWPELVRITLPLSAALLRGLARDVEVDLPTSALGVGGFQVVVAPECSGVEGLFVISILIGAFLVACRVQLRFPAALALLPLAIAIVFVANAARIAALVLLGAHVSPAIALGAFHSRAGWLLVCGIAMLVMWLGLRHPALQTRADSERSSENPVLPYLLPLFCLLLTSMMTGLFSTAIDWAYPLRVLVAALALWGLRGSYRSFARPGLDSLWAVLIGVATFALWFVLAQRDLASGDALERALAYAPSGRRASWITFRVIGATLTVPIAEELAYRGFLQRRLSQVAFHELPFTTWRWPAVLGASLAFGLSHQSIVAGALAGLAYGYAMARRGRLLDAVIAHATTNALIAVAVLCFDQWWMW